MTYKIGTIVTFRTTLASLAAAALVAIAGHMACAAT